MSNNSKIIMKKFKYDVIELISCIRDRPCLWDKSLENYKDRLERRAAWEEIFGILDEKYDDMTAEEKRLTGETVIYKWTNIRDAFLKSLKTKCGKPKRRYVLYDHLKFLLKNMPEEEYNEEEDVGTSYMKHEEDSIEIEQPVIKRRSRNIDDDYVPVPKKRSKRRESAEEILPPKTKEYGGSSIDYLGVEGDARVMNEDEAFFASLLPTVVRYDEDDKLEFRMGVLAVMKKIKDSRKWTISVEDDQ